jgi:spermidine synthase
MKPWVTLGTDKTLTLQQRDTEFALRQGGQVLMTSQRHNSEEAMAGEGLRGIERESPRVLIGGLGMGYTVRATLDRLPARSQVMVAELSRAVVDWNKTVLAHLAQRPLDDPRVEVRVADLRDVLKREGRFDAILLDVDNGPASVGVISTDGLYTNKGLALMKAALRPKGTLVIWSAGLDEAFLPRFEKAGFGARVVKARARGTGTSRHVLYVGRLPGR